MRQKRVSDLVCARCGSTEGVEMESSRTAYEPEDFTRYTLLLLDDPLDPPDRLARLCAANPDIPYCRECAVEHHGWWDEEWAGVYASQG